jgi:hypothetical protein
MAEIDYYPVASPHSDEAFLNRIRVNYLRHCCTLYDDELEELAASSRFLGRNAAKSLLRSGAIRS